MAASFSCGCTAPTTMAFASPSLNYASRCHPTATRSAVVPRAVAAPTRPAKSAELLDGRLAEQSTMNFHEYTQATQMLNRLKGQAYDLELLLDQLNALEASLDDTLLAPPSLDEPQDRAARQANRAAKRAERRAKATTAAVTGTPVAPVSDVPSAVAPQAKADSPATSRGRSAVAENIIITPTPAGPASSSISAASDVQHLEELFKLTVGEPELPQAAAVPSLLRPRKFSKKIAAAAAPAELPVAAAAAPAELPVAAAAAPAVPVDSLTERLERLLRPHTSHDDEQLNDQEEHVHGGPSDDDLRALEREGDTLELPLEEEDDEHASVLGARALEASALVSRSPEQLSISPTGPSLLSLVPASAAPGRGARVRQARRSARNGQSQSLRAGSAASMATGNPRGQKGIGKDGTVQFLSSSSSVIMLTADMEREVTEVCRDFLFLEKVKRQCQKTLHRKPTTDELAAAIGMDLMGFNLRYDAGLKAKELLLKSNYRLVMTVCKRYIGKGAHLQDLVSEGVKGLLRGVEMYDASKGFRFGTYAHWWIRQAVSRSLAETGRAVRLPVHMIEQLTKLKNATAVLSMELNREPSVQELSTAVGLPVSRIEMLMDAARSASSMETPIGGNDQGSTIKDSVQDERVAADEEFGNSSLKADMDAMLEVLAAREARVLRLRFGLEDGVEWTLEDIGSELGVTRERIRQLEAKALRKLQVKTIDVSGKLKDYSENLDMLDTKDIAARTSSGTRKT